jgi:aspartyl-tRNA(Asn)/glutamyl-tRNA(Gln) amidotransferase subunit A
VPDFTARLGEDLRGLRVGLVALDPFEPIDPEVRGAVEAAGDVLRDLGASVESVDFPVAVRAALIGVFLARAEASSFNEQLLRTRPEDYGEDVLTSLQQGAGLLALDYLRAQRLRTALCEDLAALLTGVDALILPTTRTVAGLIERPFSEIHGQPVTEGDIYTAFTIPFDLTGSPALSVPCGFSAEGLPIGLEIVGRAFDEATVLRIGAAYERATPWHERRPNI